jgi:hypothetical protein
MGIMGALEQELLAIYAYCCQSVVRIINHFYLMEPLQAVGNGLHFLFANAQPNHTSSFPYKSGQLPQPFHF